MILMAYISKLSQTVLYHAFSSFQTIYMAGNIIFLYYIPSNIGWYYLSIYFMLTVLTQSASRLHHFKGETFCREEENVLPLHCY